MKGSEVGGETERQVGRNWWLEMCIEEEADRTLVTETQS